MGLQLGPHQKYYISRCQEKSSIQLTITMPEKDNESRAKERMELIDDISRILDNIMKVFMPAVKTRPMLLVSCPKCSTLHITLDELCSGNTIFCPESGDDEIPRSKLLLISFHANGSGKIVISSCVLLCGTFPEFKGKLEVFRSYYAKLSVLVPFKEWSHYFVSAKIITNEENQIIQTAGQLPSQIASRTLNTIYHSLEIEMGDMFEKLLSIMEQ